MTGLYWHIDRWRQSSAYTEMTVEEQGAYRNLLDEATLREGSLPHDEEVLAFVACRGNVKVWRRVRNMVLSRFELVDGVLTNRVLEKVLTTSQKRIEKQQRYRDRVAAERNAGGNARRNALGNVKRHDPGNERRYQDQDQDVQELVHGQPASTDPPRQAALARPPASQVVDRHRDHLPGFCDWVCLPTQLVVERLQTAQLTPDHADDFVSWAHATREAFFGVPVDDRKPFDFWRARWSEATADATPTPAERDAWALYTRSLGRMPLTEFVLHRRRGSGTGPVAPPFANFISRKDQPA